MASSVQTTMRLMGMSSGMDTESIIQQMLKLSQLKIDKQNSSKTLLQWKQESLNTIKDEIAALRNTFLTTQGSKAMFGTSAYVSTIAETTGKNADAVKITTSTASSTGTFTIGKITSLAQGAHTESANASNNGNGFTLSTKLEDMVFTDPDDPSGSGKKLDFVDDGNGNKTAKIKIGDEEIELNATDKLGDMLDKINNSDAGVTMSYDRLSDTFKLESKTVGASSELKISGDAFATMGFAKDADGKFIVQAGTQAEVEINGQTVTKDSNTFDYRGVSITLNRTTADGEEDTKVEIKRDASGTIDKVKGFVESYNTLIKKLEGLLKESKGSQEASYTPLTEEQKYTMTEKEIEEWEKIAKKGILRNDPGLSNLVTSLRGALFEAIEGTGLSAADIGLSTGNFFGGTGGQIVLNEDKLRAAIEEDPDKVMNVFAQIAKDKDDTSAKYKQSGLLYRIDSLMSNYVKNSHETSIDSIEKSIKKANDQITVLQDRMQREEEALYRKFAAMETALSKLQSQGDWMSSMLGSA